jgi:subfamily B ATP-binding cassette protein MsbA
MQHLLKFLKPYFPQILAVWFCTLLVTTSTLLIAPLAGNAFKAIGDKNLQSLNLIALGIIGLYFVKGLFTYGQEYLSYYVSNKVIVDLRLKLYDHLQGQSLSFFSQWPTGELLSRMMNDINNLQLTILTSFTAIIPQTVLLLGLLVYIFILNWQLSLLTLIAFPLIVQLMRFFAGGLRRISERVQQKTADITSQVQETVSQIRVVQAFTMEKVENEKFKQQNDHAFAEIMRAVEILSTQTPVVALLQATAAVGIVWLGGWQIINGQLTLPQLISFATALGIMTDPGSTLSKAFAIIQQGSASIKRIFELLATKSTITDSPNARPLPRVNGRVQFNKVSFSYSQEAVLSNINLEIEPGEAIALIGRTGAGKSTLANLLPRFYDPTAGQVIIDGYDLREVTLRSLRQQVAVVPQEIALFQGTIRENIAYGQPAATETAIIDAAKLANAHQFITAFPDGYDTQVGERGTKLSGGERQRVAIARAILRDPRILILDEATSALDPETEALIRDALEKLMKGRTSVIIAHRLYTIEHVDRVVVLDSGKIVEVGPHAELIARGGLYKHLYEMQFRK